MPALGMLAAFTLCLLVCGLTPRTSHTTYSRTSTIWLGKVRMCSSIEPQSPISTAKQEEPELKTHYIYQLRCKDPGINSTYVGRSISAMGRLREYAMNCDFPMAKFIREHGGWENWEHTVLEVLYNSTIKSVNVRKKHWMDVTKADLNIFNPAGGDDWKAGGIKKMQYVAEYAIANKDAIKAGRKEYFSNNKDAIYARKKEYYLNNEDALIAMRNQSNKWRADNRAATRVKARVKLAENRDTINARRRERNAENRPALNAKARERRAVNRTAINAKAREYRAENRATMNALRREKNAENRPAINAKAKEYYSNNKETVIAKAREYREMNRAAVNAKARERHAEKRSQKLSESTEVVAEDLN